MHCEVKESKPASFLGGRQRNQLRCIHTREHAAESRGWISWFRARAADANEEARAVPSARGGGQGFGGDCEIDRQVFKNVPTPFKQT